MKPHTNIDINIENFILNEKTLPKQQEEYLDVIFTNKTTKDITINFNKLKFPFATSAITSSKLISAKTFQNADNKQIYDISLKNIELLNFLPGDTIGILPENNDNEVEFILEVLTLSEKADESCIVKVKAETTKKGAKIPLYIPNTEITCRLILKHLLDFKSIPKKGFIRSLLEYCEYEKEKEFLKTLCSKEGSEFYNEIILNNGINVLDIFKICQTLKPPISLLIEHLPRLLPRPYSISNYYLNSPDKIRIIFSCLVKRPGITTDYLKNKVYNFLNNIESSNSINLYFRQPTKFRLIEEYYTKDIIMISIGCGISPFLGFLEQKKYLTANGLDIGDWYLYSGFQCKSCVIERDLILQYENDGILEKYYECLSKDENAKFKYVQDAINETQNEFISLIQNDNCLIFVCADGNKISKDIKTYIQKCVFGNIDINSKQFIEEWIKNGKYIEDIWT